MNQVIENGLLRAEIKELGAELTSVKNGKGYEFIWQGDEKFWAKQCPVLFPICGRLIENKYTYEGKTYTMKSHGFASASDFSAEKTAENEVVFTLKENDKTLAQYPFRFVFSVRYRLEGSELFVEYRVKNTDDKTIYFNFGSHEAYRTEGVFEDWSVEFEKKEDLYVDVQPVLGYLNGEIKLFRKDVKDLPMSAELFEEDSVILDKLQSKEITLKHRGERVVSVRFDAFEHLLLWKKPGAPYLCIEPWNGIPDFWGKSGDITKKPCVIALKSGESYAAEHSIRFYDVKI